MITEPKILGLLHDTCLKAIKTENDILQFLFTFYLPDKKEYNVEFVSEQTSNINCVEFYCDNTENQLNINNLQEVDCIKAEQIADTFEFLLENIETGNIIKLTFNSGSNHILGDVKQLKQFWDIND